MTPVARFPRAGDRQGAVEGRLPRRFGLKRATRMTLESHDEASTFEKVARLIAEEEGDVQWLVNGLRGWIWPQERYPASARKHGHGRGMFADIARTRWSRAKVLKALKKTLPRAADTLLAEPPA
jgi:hypothetical protein